jgi:hypothetical protein
MTVSVILDPAIGAIVLHLMLFFRPSIAKVFDKPRAPSFAEIQKNRQFILLTVYDDYHT